MYEENRSTQAAADAPVHLVQAIAELGIPVAAQEPLARHTTFRIGGPADLYAVASTVEQLARLAEIAAEHGAPATVLGGGSNILVSDAGVRGLVIANQTREIAWHGARGGEPSAQPGVVADSGVLLAGLARTAIKAGLSGLEWAVSVPGTVGGAAIGNAGAHGGDIAASLSWAQVFYPGQGHRILTNEALGFAYRSSVLKRQLMAADARPVILSATFNLTPGDATEMASRAEAYLARRRASQPVEPSAGSIFRNPPGDHAGRLVEAVGLKGHRIGGAQISPRHANFIVNTGNARAADVRALLGLMRQRVLESTGIELVSEIQLIGEWDAA